MTASSEADSSGSQDDEVLERDVSTVPVDMNHRWCVHHLVADLQQAEHPTVDVGIWYGEWGGSR